MTTPIAYLNGRLVPVGEATVPVTDWGFLYGDTLFETMRVHAGEPMFWRAHMRRLEQGMATLAYPARPERDELLDALRRTLDANELAEASARITVSRGTVSSGFDMRAATDPLRLITVRPYAPPPARFVEQGLKLRSVRVPPRASWPRYSAKSGNYLDQLLALDRALESGCDEALLVDNRGRVLEGSRSNVFIVRRGVILTPPVRLGLLPGTVREAVIRRARSAGTPTRSHSIGLRGAMAADEAFVTNSLWGVLPVYSIDDREIDRSPGPVTTELMRRWNIWLNATGAQRT